MTLAARAAGFVLMTISLFMVPAVSGLFVQWRHAEGYRLAEIELLTAQRRKDYTVQVALPDGEEIAYDRSPFLDLPKGTRVKVWYNPDAYVDMAVLSIDERLLTEQGHGPPADGQVLAAWALFLVGFGAGGGFLAFRRRD